MYKRYDYDFKILVFILFKNLISATNSVVFVNYLLVRIDFAIGNTCGFH